MTPPVNSPDFDFQDAPVLDDEPVVAAPSDEVPNGLFQVAGLIGFFAGILALIVVLGWIIIGGDGSSSSSTTTIVRKAAAAAPGTAAAPTLAQAKGVAFEKFAKVDPTLPAVPAGAIKRFTVDVDQHVVQVSKDLAPIEAWTYTVNGKLYKGAAASPPIVVEQPRSPRQGGRRSGRQPPARGVDRGSGSR